MTMKPVVPIASVVAIASKVRRRRRASRFIAMLVVWTKYNGSRKY